LAARVDYKASVAKDLRKLDRQTAERILRKIEQVLASEQGHGKPLAGQFAGLCSLRVGDYRVVYASMEGRYLVLRIAHRRDVYAKGRPDLN